MHKSLKEFKRDNYAQYYWLAYLFICMSLLIVGWAQSFPVSYSQFEVPVITSVSLLFWIGFWLGFPGLAGLVLSAKSRYLHWIASLLFVLWFAAPQSLYLSWGSDAGALADLVRYTQSTVGFNFQRDIASISYLQWPSSIFFQQFITDLSRIDINPAILIGFLPIILCISGGLYILWDSSIPQKPNSSRAIFWGIVAYFAGFFWLFNWQAVPYAFSLALLFPALALLVKRTWQHRILFILLFLVSIETHPIIGVWMIFLVTTLVILTFLIKGKQKAYSVNLAITLIVAQLTILVFKNIRFLTYLAYNLSGYYQAMLETSASDKSLLLQAGNALSHLPSDLLGTILKTLSWVDIFVIGLAFAVATYNTLINHRFRMLEIALFVVGAIHFLIGTRYAAIGTRSLQLMALLPAYSVVVILANGSSNANARWIVLLACLLGLVLYPSAIMRSHQTTNNYVRPADGILNNFLVENSRNFPEVLSILAPGRIRSTRYSTNTYINIFNPRTVGIMGCAGNYFVVDTPEYRQYVEFAARELDLKVEVQPQLNRMALDLSAFYDNGPMILRIGQDCRDMDWMWKK